MARSEDSVDDRDAAAKAKRYRERAEALRATGLDNSHPENRWILLDGADAFYRLAHFLEQNDRTPAILHPRRSLLPGEAVINFDQPLRQAADMILAAWRFLALSSFTARILPERW